MAESSSPSQPPLPPSSQPPPSTQAQALSQESGTPSSQPAAAAAGAGPSVSTSGEVIPGSTSGTSPVQVIPKPDPDAEGGASIEQEDVDMTAGENSNSTTMPNNNADPKNSAGEGASLPTAINPLAASAPPSKKETSLREFLGKMDEYAPIIPDAVTAHYLTVAGLPPPGNGPNQTPHHLARLLALATQKFIADIAADSYQYARIRASNSSSANNPMGILNAASGLGGPGGGAVGAGAGAAGGAGGVSGGGGDAGKGGGKAGTHLGIQRPGYGGGGSGGAGQGRTVLTMEDLGMAVAEYGVSLKRGEFYR